eukprot:SAG31_NODE_2944_length_4874_cov_30.998953_2_plen_109_part_00
MRHVPDVPRHHQHPLRQAIACRRVALQRREMHPRFEPVAAGSPFVHNVARAQQPGAPRARAGARGAGRVPAGTGKFKLQTAEPGAVLLNLVIIAKFSTQVDLGLPGPE